MKQILKKTKRFLQKASEKDSVMLILSVLFAVMLWSYIVSREYPDAREVIKGVQIDYEASISGTPAEAEGYRIYDADVSEVDILVVANRTELGDLDKSMFYAKVSADNYNGEQPVTARIQLYKSEDNDIDCDYRLTDVKKAKVYFYKEITRTLDVSVKAPGITAAEGYKLKSLTCDQISVTGPEPYVNMISGCTLEIPQNVAYDTRKSIPVTVSLSNLTFTNEDGDDINNLIKPYFSKDQFRINKKELSVMVNISMVKNLDITYRLSEVPEYFNQKFITDRLSLSTSVISVSSDDPSIQEIDNLPVAIDQNIPLNKISKNFSATFDLTKALESYPKLTNDSNIFASYVSFDSTGLEEKTFDSVSSSQFNIKNPYASKYSAEFVTQYLSNVTIIGPEADVAKITADDLKVEIDLSKSSVSDTGKINTGRSTYKALILPPDKYKNVWIYGEYTVEVDISEVPEVPKVTTGVSTAVTE